MALAIIYMNLDDFNAGNFSSYDSGHSCLSVSPCNPRLQDWFNLGDSDKVGLIINTGPLHSRDMTFIGEVDVGYSIDLLPVVRHPPGDVDQHRHRSEWRRCPHPLLLRLLLSLRWRPLLQSSHVQRDDGQSSQLSTTFIAGCGDGCDDSHAHVAQLG